MTTQCNVKKVVDLEEEAYILKQLEYQNFTDALREAIDSYIEESCNHFLISRSRSIKDDGRYMYTKKELDNFIKLFTQKGGNLDDLHIGIVRSGTREFLCYEICRKKYYELEVNRGVRGSFDDCDNGDRVFYS